MKTIRLRKLTYLMSLTASLGLATAVVGCAETGTGDGNYYEQAGDSLKLPRVIDDTDNDLVNNRVYTLNLTELKTSVRDGLEATDPFSKAVEFWAANYTKRSAHDALKVADSTENQQLNLILTKLASALKVPSMSFIVEENIAATSASTTYQARFFFAAGSNAGEWAGVKLGSAWGYETNPQTLYTGLYTVVLQSITNTNHGQPTPTASAPSCMVQYNSIVKSDDFNTGVVPFYTEPDNKSELAETRANFTRSPVRMICANDGRTYFQLSYGPWVSSDAVHVVDATKCTSLPARCYDYELCKLTHIGTQSAFVRIGPGTGYAKVSGSVFKPTESVGANKRCGDWFHSRELGGWTSNNSSWVDATPGCSDIPEDCAQPE